MSKIPSFQFYPGDWMKDPALRSVSLAARGLWTDILCLMFEAPRRGHLIFGTAPVTAEQLARMVGSSADEVSCLLDELLACGVATKSAAGVITSRRMVRDEQIRAQRARCGKLGGNPCLLKQNSTKAQPNANHRVNHPANQNPTPSSSSSSSSSEDTEDTHTPRAHEAGNGVEPEQRSASATVSEEEPRSVGSREIPDWPSVKAVADAIGLPEWRARLWFDDMDAVGWVHRGQPVRKWRPLLTSVRTYWEADGRPSQPTARNGSTRQTQREKEAALHNKKSRFGW